MMKVKTYKIFKEKNQKSKEKMINLKKQKKVNPE